jgi:hypothetical protein
MAEIDEILKLVATIRGRTKDDATLKLVDELDKRLRALPAVVPAEQVTRVEPLDLARSFRGVIDEIQAEARQSAVAGVTIKAMDIEVKGLVEAAPGATRLVLPSSATQVDPNALSTLRVSFGVVPVLPAEAQPEPTPKVAPAQPTRATRSPAKPKPKPKPKPR